MSAIAIPWSASRYGLALVTAPARLPVTLGEIRQHSRIDLPEDDGLLMGYAQAATSHLDGKDGILGRALISQTWDLTLDQFPPGGAAIRPPLGTLQSVTSITYTDTNGDAQTWSSANYQVDTGPEPGRIYPAFNTFYPAARWDIATVTVRYVVGYGTLPSDVPEPLRLAILMLVSHWYEQREPIITGTIVAKTPYAVDALVAPYRLNYLA